VHWKITVTTVTTTPRASRPGPAVHPLVTAGHGSVTVWVGEESQ
jgi:hypothetical protein